MILAGLSGKRDTSGMVGEDGQDGGFFRIEPVDVGLDPGRLLVGDLPVGAAFSHLFDRLLGVAVDGVVILGHCHLLGNITKGDSPRTWHKVDW